MTKVRDFLKTYNAKRNFKKTQEPDGTETKTQKRKKPIFVVQQHAATRLHWDFRLELDGVLKSWAVTNEPVADPSVKRLAVEVEDHPLSYATFAGDIPKGQYGGGHVDIWDTGTWEPVGDPHAGLKAGKLSFNLTGKRLKGHWSLIRMRFGGKRQNWLLIKANDEFAVSGAAEKTSKPLKAKTATKATKTVKKNKLVPYDPVLALRVDKPPTGQDWLHEIKYDGYRALVSIAKGHVTVTTRNGQDWTAKFPDIVAAAKTLKVQSAAIDGEIIVLNDKGISDFSLLQQTLSGDINEPMRFMAFDILELDGTDLKSQPLSARKSALAKIVTGKGLKGKIEYSDHVIGNGEKFFRQAQAMTLEGIISKRVASPYTAGRTGDWVKVKITQVDEFVIAGILRRSDDPKRVGAVLLGTFATDGFRYAGKSGTGFPLSISNEILRRAKTIQTKKSPFTTGLKPKEKQVEWLKPELVGVIEYTELTRDNLVRHGVFKGLREDKPARQVKAEKITPIKNMVTSPAQPGDRFAGVTITHPDRIVYPEDGLTKADVAAYYNAMADLILPYVQKRPISVIRCPDGLKKACFVQRHIDGKAADRLTQLPIKDETSGESYFSIDTKEGLLSLVQFGVIEFHPWGSKAPKFNRPDTMIFDLDPDPNIDWPSLKAAADVVKDYLSKLGLKSLPKISGGKGIHIVVPIQPLYEWEPIKEMSRAIAETLERDYPDAFTTSSTKAKRKGKIYIDYVRNDYANTAVAPFSLRARPGAGFAMPLTWPMVKRLTSRDGYCLAAVIGSKMKKLTDPWRKVVLKPQRISAALFKTLKG